jgi:uncharacterized heparinase superfamily protein
MYRDPTSSAFDMFRMMANAAQSFSQFQGMQTPGAPAASAQKQQVMDLYVAFMNSGYRYLARWAEISARRYPEFAQTLSTMSSETDAARQQTAALLDSIRGYLREMAELPMAESERLQADIERIMDAAKASSAPAQEPGAQAPRPAASKRRARAKR